MSELIEHKEIARLFKVGNLESKLIARLAMKLLSMDKINLLYKAHGTKSTISFIDAVFEELGIEFVYNEAELKNIPLKDAFITVSNHPYGAIEGMFLFKLLLIQRSDIKLLTNFLLQRIEAFSSHTLPVNPFQDVKQSSTGGLKAALRHLNNGHPLGLFPAGEVSRFHLKKKRVLDSEWKLGILKLIQKAEVPVVPIYFQGKNSVLFHLLGMIHPKLGTARLGREVFNKSKKTIRVRIGKAITIKEQNEFSSPSQLGRYLRAKTYALGSPLKVNKFYKPNFKALKKPEAILDREPEHILLEEIKQLKKEHFLFAQKEFDVFIAPSKSIPHLLNEICRLREIAFRDVGEGTNRPLDLDEYDLYYQHLFLWDRESHQVAGAYRIGKGAEIMEIYGKQGFYINSLFRIKSPLLPVLKQSIELGRSFVAKDYQKKMLPLFLLWRGILLFLVKNKEYRYLTGPVSISNKFSKLSKGLIIEFIKRNHYRSDLAQHVKPRKKFKSKWKHVDAMSLLEKYGNDFKQLDQLIQDIEPSSMNIPVLLKKYMKQNAKIIGFNVDPKFEMALDGLIVLDLNDIPKETLEGLKTEFEL